MAECTAKEMELSGYAVGEEENWVPLSDIFGGAAVPKEASKVIREALSRMKKEGHVGQRNAWQAIEFWAADYLGTPSHGNNQL